MAAAIICEQRNPLFLDGIELPPGIAATADMGAAVKDAEVVLLAPPAQYMRAVAGSLKSHLQKGVAVVSCSKGMERGTLALMPEVLREVLPRSPAAVLSGPSFARELAGGLPCGVALACADPAVAVRLARTLAARAGRYGDRRRAALVDALSESLTPARALFLVGGAGAVPRRLGEA